MAWEQLITEERICREKQYEKQPHRPPWQTDSDRITFSSAFRRLQDKTQVFPLSSSDYVRTRLTHSLEVASVGKTLGSRIGFLLKDDLRVPLERHPLEIGQIVSAVTLAHDIGNPPFGHSGENSIRSWFETSLAIAKLRGELTPNQRADFEDYEGNAQGFRVLARLQMNKDKGGMQLTATTLAAFTKYPTQSRAVGAESYNGKSAKKFGFFQADRELFAEVARRTGMKIRDGFEYCWCRHPLAFIVEAADDICYRIVDLEDAYRQKLASFKEVADLLNAVIGEPDKIERAHSEDEEDTKVDVLRSLAIGKAIEKAVEAFASNYNGIMDGSFDEALLESDKSFWKTFEDIKAVQKSRVYRNERVLRVEATGFRVIAGILEPFAQAIEDVFHHTFDKAPRCSAKIFELIPAQFIGKDRIPNENPYERLIRIVDYVCGMTDSYALNLYRNISGISLP